MVGTAPLTENLHEIKKPFEGAIDNVELHTVHWFARQIKPAMIKGERASKNAAFVDAVDFLA